jgi:FKBP-type peptidyl-prolyl cis-trans isomerase FkpA
MLGFATPAQPTELQLLVRAVRWQIPVSPTEFLDAMTTTAASILIEDLLVGEGQQATGPGQFVTVHYTGWLENGTEFDSSRRREPFSFPLGVGYVIPGWDQGLVGMCIGGKRRLTIPPALGYGASGMGKVIPPNAVLVFEIELLEISE